MSIKTLLNNSTKIIGIGTIFTLLAFPMVSRYYQAETVNVFAGIPSTASTQTQEVKQTEKQQQIHAKTTPIPELQTSTERVNLIKRLKLINDNNKVMFIYLMSDSGLIVMQDTIKGKVSSLNSYLTTPQQLIANNGESCSSTLNTSTCNVVDSPDLDGTYGKNPEGVFWFNDTGAYREWTGKYVVSDQEFSITTPITLVKNK
jgi:hypothetical protein